MTSARTRAALALTLTCSSLLIATTAHADTACGTPAVGATYDTVHADAVTHLELKWSTTVVDTAAVPAWSEPDVVVPATFETVTVVDKEAWDETVVDKEAWDETVVDKEAWSETVVDKEAWSETVVDKEAWVETVTDAWAYDRYVVTQQATYYRMNEWRYRNIFGNTLYYLLVSRRHRSERRRVEPHGQLVLGGSAPAGLLGNRSRSHPHGSTRPQTHVVNHDAETHVVNHPAETHVVTQATPRHTSSATLRSTTRSRSSTSPSTACPASTTTPSRRSRTRSTGGPPRLPATSGSGPTSHASSSTPRRPTPRSSSTPAFRGWRRVPRPLVTGGAG